jgi:hypothetical protein
MESWHPQLENKNQMKDSELVFMISLPARFFEFDGSGGGKFHDTQTFIRSIEILFTNHRIGYFQPAFGWLRPGAHSGSHA